MTWTAIGTDLTIESVTYRNTEDEDGEFVCLRVASCSIEFTIEEYEAFGERIQNLPIVEQLREEAIETEDGVHAHSELEMRKGKVEGEVKTDGK